MRFNVALTLLATAAILAACSDRPEAPVEGAGGDAGDAGAGADYAALKQMKRSVDASDAAVLSNPPTGSVDNQSAAFGRLGRQWECGDNKQTFITNADVTRVDIIFEWPDGTKETLPTTDVHHEGQIISFLLPYAEELTTYSYDVSRDSLTWVDLEGNSHVCRPL